MTAVAFDTLKFARTLRDKAKLSIEQPEGFADAMAEAFQGDIATKGDIASVRVDIATLTVATQTDIETLRVSTRADIEALRLSTRSDLREVELRLEAKIEASKADIIRWMFGTIGFQTLIVLGAVITLARIVR